MNRHTKMLLPIISGILLVAGLFVLLHVQAAQAAATPGKAQVIDSGLAYIKAQQQPGGGITGFSGVADPDTTARSVLAYVVAGKAPGEVVSSDGHSLMDYLAAQAITFTHDTTGTLFPGRAGELLTAVAAAGMNVNSFGGMDLAKELIASYHTDTGAYSTTAKQDSSSGEASGLNQAWAILGLSLAGQSVPEGATQNLVKSQAADGSWGAGDPDTTALAVTALLASHNLAVKDHTIQKAIEFFHSTQLDTGGWKPSWDNDPLNADSTGWAIQALVSAGEDLLGQSWMKNNTNPIAALLAFQKPDGAIGGTYANTYSTAEAIIGLAGIPLSTFTQAGMTHQAGLAIFSGDNSVITKCITFTESSITGLQLLQRSQLPVETSTNPTQGTAVCKIGNVGDAANNCFGSMPNYWAYFVLGTSGWEYSPVGADQSPVMDGGVYAWSWGTGNPPPSLTFQNICGGVAFMLPTSTIAPTSSTEISQATPVSTFVTILNVPYPTPPPSSPATLAYPAAKTNTSNYIIYALILLVLAVFIIYLIRSRRG